MDVQWRSMAGSHIGASFESFSASTTWFQVHGKTAITFKWTWGAWCLPGADVVGVVLTHCDKLILSAMRTKECHDAGHNGTWMTLVVDIGMRQPKF